MTRVVVTLLAGGDHLELARAQTAFHLAAGADAVLIGDVDGAAEWAQSDGDTRVHVVRVGDSGGRRALARAGVESQMADWVIDLRPAEFWWPRGESFQDVLAPMPPRYGVVQGLVRAFVPRPDDGRPIWERTTVRRSFLELPPEPGTVPSSLLRPAYRAHPELDPEQPGGGPGALQPLRAWYPIEVLTLEGGGAPLHDDEVERGLADRSLVVDERLRDALAALERGEPPTFGVPGVVDDAAYAGECAAVGEVDLESLDRQIRELESRIVELEARFWPRVQRVASRIVRRDR